VGGLRLEDDEPLVIVGDVHGEVDRLRKAFEDLGSLDRRIVFVGDYINRGPHSRAAMEVLVAYKRELGDSLVLLRGNHEVALLQTLATGDTTELLRHRGASTIKSYVGEVSGDVLEHFVANFPETHYRLLLEMPNFAENSSVLISHVGYNPSRPASRSEEDVTTGHWPCLLTDEPAPSAPRGSVVFGHYAQYSGEPFVRGPLVALDTACGTIAGNPLSAVLLPERNFRQY
jgi:serine/threonine protein phosphatase 1